MGAGPAARSCARGGTDISQSRSPRVRLIAGFLAFASAATVAILALDSLNPIVAQVLGSFGLVGLLAFAGAMAFAQPGWIAPVLGYLGLLVLLKIVLLQTIDVVAAGLAGVGLLSAGELAQWSIDARHRGRYDGRVQISRAVGIAVLLLRGIGVVLVAGIAAVLPVSGGLELMLIATAAAVGLFGLAALADARTG